MRVRFFALLAVVALVASGYAFTEEAGPSPAAAPMPAPARVQPAEPAARCPIPADYRGAFVRAANETRLPLALLVAVAETESEMHADAVSVAGARGLLQLMPATAAELHVDPDRPEANVLGGARYLRALLDRLGSSDLALAAYNAGPGAVERAGGAPSHDVLTYVANVTARWRTLAGCR
jgi:soluble lytic murein transglycosylase-like protein